MKIITNFNLLLFSILRCLFIKYYYPISTQKSHYGHGVSNWRSAEIVFKIEISYSSFLLSIVRKDHYTYSSLNAIIHFYFRKKTNLHRWECCDFFSLTAREARRALTWRPPPCPPFRWGWWLLLLPISIFNILLILSFMMTLLKLHPHFRWGLSLFLFENRVKNAIFLFF